MHIFQNKNWTTTVIIRQKLKGGQDFIILAFCMKLRKASDLDPDQRLLPAGSKFRRAKLAIIHKTIKNSVCKSVKGFDTILEDTYLDPKPYLYLAKNLDPEPVNH